MTKVKEDKIKKREDKRHGRTGQDKTRQYKIKTKANKDYTREEEKGEDKTGQGKTRQ